MSEPPRVAIASKIWWKARGMMPRSSGGSFTPSIVNVLPVPVCPYAKIVPLKPSSTESTIRLAVCAYKFSCFVVSSYTWSKVNVFGTSDGWLFAGCSTTVPRVVSISTTFWLPFCRSLELSGRQRTTTRTVSEGGMARSKSAAVAPRV